MSLTDGKATGGGEKKQMTLPKTGNRPAILTGLIDIGVQTRTYKGETKEPKREFIPIYTLTSDTYETEEGETRNCTVRPFPIRHMPGATRGKYYDWFTAIDPTKEKLDAKGQGNVFEVVGNPCFAAVTHSEPDEEGFVYPNCSGIAAYPEDFPVPELEYEPLIFNLDDPDREVFESLNTWIQDQIRNSRDYAGSEAEAILEGKGPAPKQEAEEQEETQDDVESPI